MISENDRTPDEWGVAICRVRGFCDENQIRKVDFLNQLRSILPRSCSDYDLMTSSPDLISKALDDCIEKWFKK